MTDIPRPEHPRPDLQREAWLNLNGPWRFEFDPQLIGEQMRWYASGSAKDLTITVPFPWESRLSGVAAPDYKGAAWYEREFTIPAEWEGLTPLLHFGAIDWLARVWINGQLAAESQNGYLPFSVDLSAYGGPGETLTVTVRAYDVADATTWVGKQVPRWYTYSSGIWQTVWLEGRAPSHITDLRLDPDAAQGQVTVRCSLTVADAGTYTLRMVSDNGAFEDLEQAFDLATGQQEITLIVPVPSPQLWSPESPHLYDFDIELEPEGGIADRLHSYFGFRTVSRAPWDGKEYEYILLNGEPVYLRGALDQAFHPDSLHGYPSDDVIRADIQLAKDLGLNMLRCHIKVNDPRYYYWADRLGMLIFYDMPSADLDSPAMRGVFETGMRRAMARDHNHPSIIAWIVFNETWGLTKHDTDDGQHWVQEMMRLAKSLDPSRLVEDNSPNKYDHVETDINSWHFYINDYDQARSHIQRVVDLTYPGSEFNYVGGQYVQDRAPLMNSEYAGIAARMGDRDIAWSFKYLTTDLRRHDKICGYVYTELDDIEWEHNGFVNYDRSHKEFGYDYFVDGMGVPDLTGADLVGADSPPCATLPPASEWIVPLFVSHWGPPLPEARVRWQADFVDRFGEKRQIADGQHDVEPVRYSVIDAGEARLTLPDENGLVTLALWLEDEAGEVRARNYINVEVRESESPRAEKVANIWALRFSPENATRMSWPRPLSPAGGGKFAAAGSGWVEYEVELPHEMDVSAIRSLTLRLEIAARAGLAKVDWPSKLYGVNYPQTERNRKYPTHVAVSLNDIAVGEMDLPDDPADARGVLSHHRNIDPGSYGYLTDVRIDGSTLNQVLGTMDENTEVLRVRFTVPVLGSSSGVRVIGGGLRSMENSGGIALYGETLGCYPVDPTVLLEA